MDWLVVALIAGAGLGLGALLALRRRRARLKQEDLEQDIYPLW